MLTLVCVHLAYLHTYIHIFFSTQHCLLKQASLSPNIKPASCLALNMIPNQEVQLSKFWRYQWQGRSWDLMLDRGIHFWKWSDSAGPWIPVDYQWTHDRWVLKNGIYTNLVNAQFHNYLIQWKDMALHLLPAIDYLIRSWPCDMLTNLCRAKHLPKTPKSTSTSNSRAGLWH